MTQKNRRKFIQQLGLAGAGLMAGNQLLAATENSSESLYRNFKPVGAGASIRMGLIGAGGMGTEDMKTALLHEGVTVTAVCDLYQGRLEAAKERWAADCF
jgi:hypothetical protein